MMIYWIELIPNVFQFAPEIMKSDKLHKNKKIVFCKILEFESNQILIKLLHLVHIQYTFDYTGWPIVSGYGPIGSWLLQFLQSTQ